MFKIPLGCQGQGLSPGPILKDEAVAEKRGGVVAAAHERLVAVERAADGRQSVLRKVREVFAARAGSRSVDHFDVGRVTGRSQADADENLSAV